MTYSTPRRWLLAAAAILAGCFISGALLIATNPDSGSAEVYVCAHDVVAGAPLGPGTVRLQRMRIEVPSRLTFGRGSELELSRSRTSHQLAAGQLIQRSDLAPASEGGDRRLVWLPVKDVPAVAAGDRVDLLLLSGAGDRASVAPLAYGVAVRAVQGGGIVVSVPSKQASALAYAAANLRLGAVLLEPGSGRGQEAAVSSLEQALEALRQ